MTDAFYLWFFKEKCDWTHGNYANSVMNMERNSSEPGFREQFTDDALVDGAVRFAMMTLDRQIHFVDMYSRRLDTLEAELAADRASIIKWRGEKCP